MRSWKKWGMGGMLIWVLITMIINIIGGVECWDGGRHGDKCEYIKPIVKFLLPADGLLGSLYPFIFGFLLGVVLAITLNAKEKRK